MNRVKAAAAACILASSALATAEAYPPPGPPGPPGPNGPHSGQGAPHPQAAPKHSQSEYPGLFDIPYDAILLSVVPAGHTFNNVHRREPGGEFSAPKGVTHPPPNRGHSFIGDGGYANAADCSQAIPFTLEEGKLARNGHFLTADPDFVYVPFARPLPTDMVAHTFSVKDGYLRWTNERFHEGHAGFCKVPDGQVYATFHNQNTWPFDCEPVDIWVDLAEWCRDRQIAHEHEGQGADYGRRVGYPINEHEKPHEHGHDEPHHSMMARTEQHHKDKDHDKKHDKDHDKKHHDKDHKKDHKKDKHHKDHDKGHKKEHHTKTKHHKTTPHHQPTYSHHSSYPTHSSYHPSSSYPTSSYHTSYSTHTSYSYSDVPYTSAPPSSAPYSAVPYSSAPYSSEPYSAVPYSAEPYSSETPVPYVVETPTEKGIYPVDASPTGYDCAPTPMSWHMGVPNPTFIKDEL
ncbi:hypothetical protein GGR53DRAFT_528742 [Hypoxylon sp. FL1150]|nr:hypothetical protein GGR53DRAFT_528742 [Hypoxylon sp. FL1150]